MRAIILDMYGVILKEPGDSFFVFVQQKYPELSQKEIYNCWNLADIGTISSLEVFRRLGFQGNLEEIQRDYLDTIEIDETFYAFAQNMKKKFRLALLSNDASEWSEYLRKRFKINEFFDVLAVSGDLKIKKPDKRIFQYTVDRLGCVPADCIYVDDRRKNLGAAQALGLTPILFNRRNVEYQGECVYSFRELEDKIEAAI